MERYISVKSASDSTIVLNAPEIPLVKVWRKRDSFYPIREDALIQAYYNTSLRSLMEQGVLVVDDKDFLVAVGIINTPEEESPIIELTPTLMKRCVGPMPLVDLKNTLSQLSRYQVEELADYAVAHYREVNMDKIDILSKVANKDILKAIELYRKAQED